MLNRLDEMLNFHTQALRVRDQRQQVLASNIANADTPNYKARDLDFNTALQGALKGTGTGTPTTGSVRLTTTAPGHLAGSPGLASAAGLLYRNPAQGSVDGNTVDVDAERAAMAENTVHYEFNLTRLSQQIKGLLSAIQG